MNHLNLSRNNPTSHVVEKNNGAWQATTAWNLPGDRRLEITTWRASTTRVVETRAAVFLMKDENGPCRIHVFGNSLLADYRHVIRRAQILRLNERNLLEQHMPAIEDLFDAVVNDVARHYKLKGVAA